MTIVLSLVAMTPMAGDDKPPFGDPKKKTPKKPPAKKPKTPGKKKAPRPVRMPHDDDPPWL